MDVVTTSGPATGETAEASRWRVRAGLGDFPLALASGVTPENAATYADVDAFLVATGINQPGDFYSIDGTRRGPASGHQRAWKSKDKMTNATAERSSDKGPRDDRWYLRLMAPNTKGSGFAWLDPTSIYINGSAFHDLLDDLAADLKDVRADVVGGLDAMGFVLGSALAARIGVGFLPIRKAGKLCVDTDKVAFTNYSGRTQDMEMRIPAFAPGTRVLLVDQWIETGGTMEAISLVTRQGAIAGIASVLWIMPDRRL